MLTHHQYNLLNNSGKVWANLEVFSRARDPRYLPDFLSGDPITGSVHLKLDRPDSVRSVKISVIGQIGSFTVDNATAFEFLNVSQTIWTASADPPIGKGNNTGKVQDLVGEHTWPFCISLPKDINLQVDAVSHTFTLPPSFFETGAKISIQYELVCTIARGRLRIDSRRVRYSLGTLIGYTPIIRPPPPSALRQKSYRDNKPLVGLRDCLGWLSLAPLFITHGGGIGHANCTLSIAKPLLYTRGTVIPLLLNIESSADELVELLASPKEIVANLVRYIRHHPDTQTTDVNRVGTTKVFQEIIGTAVWWLQQDEMQCRRTLQGEIRLSRDLKPSFSFAHLNLRVCHHRCTSTGVR
ncbi:hypothetical protein PUNSTDRAFT_63844 [Punctularia strigosozonata HHB-11173 SS5]|uniref:uncharacterized protein n=1 Tax=Punctularia strigosozonata (strain HHB-11173) TaxID=741275 RepID=UPI0004418510|nr:uncharacterized protein PUNSTDRAFT_63844 [Punctularia strigosozonata HHB-11173 SS5]EIN10869.1 hypothetical protein PUNSTDRAFT_63844 [Punctularia strigosozonata HHB-11173 SS5]